MRKSKTLLSILRIALGWLFFWAFLDKLFGLGFSTCAKIGPMCSDAWLKGGSPTAGFLNYAARGPFADYYHSLAGSPIIAWAFMLILLFLGISLMFGVYTKFGATLGAALMLTIYGAQIPPEHNPILDEHIIYALALLYIAKTSRKKFK
ncbi:MAG: hypothetical protein COU09_01730 [Candidatus Harrisonbacteria bacterium CG10_big_fil_rev_8_21_14_0_10_44_23]|uniref:DoxX family protein n=1 Tax=Candidatus Harrisonbacteria bacterium CG10_big_fil_rev_8_21_14_0_10_44_23 TaxID=1974585 RepID=A0A2H0UQA2_9BACT|nr:MAG: hypothetical protein COU09_01730 [Candidatus Harrisonbacteria bacterium CG10_big_fil_rev_8_21_14_0_10_44_23]